MQPVPHTGLQMSIQRGYAAFPLRTEEIRVSAKQSPVISRADLHTIIAGFGIWRDGNLCLLSRAELARVMKLR